ncbi:hypothetical protein DSM25558_5468 [Agrobacterium sp. DSM 25558]|uniref:hypothetical protein n=1 Tax=Agrobacterium sp. DSM 25558 TaxID=1907665 RepID=UPI00097260F6|nr:hypothetical protein [Agrobacterium sp. DSM 25558]SCX32452.1 hypothetical protein DSM25558_5468 [Agrobacterium sp. DSM 25558]
MRFAIIFAVLAVVGGAGAFYTSKETAPNFSSYYIATMEKHPDLVSKHVGETWQSCLPSNDQVNPVTQPVRSLVADTIARSMLFIAQEKTPEEASRELVPWILERSKLLSAAEKDSFLALARKVNNVDIQLCVMSSLQSSAGFRLNSSIAGWELRR